jgi:cytochrome b
MDRLTTQSRPGRAQRPATIPVWDLGVRLFHWALVAAMAYEFLFEAGTQTHIILGYAILALLAFRILWGFIGGHHARFRQFVRGPATVLSYLMDIARGRPRHYHGHNPAGGAMVVALIVMVAATSLTGWAMISDALWGEEWIENLHEGLAWATLGLIVLHVAGVILASVQHRENLVHAMITGQKPAGGE